MCKKVLILFLTLMISLSVSGCSRNFSDRDMDIYEKIHKKYATLKSYSADIDLAVFSNKTENRYFVAQKYLSPDKFFTRTTDGDATFSVTTITNGADTKTVADGSEYSLILPSEDFVNLLFVNGFFSAFYASEETSLSVNSSLTESAKTVLSVDFFKDDFRIKRASLSVDNKTLLPHTLTAYDENGETLLVAKYENFEFNDKIDDSVFNIK